MAEYHVGCGLAGIYAGTVNPKRPYEWRSKSDVTKEAEAAVAQHLLLGGKEFRFTYEGEDYVLKVEKEQDGSAQEGTR